MFLIFLGERWGMYKHIKSIRVVKMQPRQTGSDAFVGKLLYRKHVAPLYYCILITVFLLIGLKMTILGRRK